MEKYYRISEEELRDLLDAYYRFTALEQGGVGSWSWYDDSMEDFIKNYNEENPNYKVKYMEDIAYIEIENYDVIKEE